MAIENHAITQVLSPQFKYTDILRQTEADTKPGLPCPPTDRIDAVSFGHVFSGKDGDVGGAVTFDMHLPHDIVQQMLFQVRQAVSGTTVTCHRRCQCLAPQVTFWWQRQ